MHGEHQHIDVQPLRFDVFQQLQAAGAIRYTPGVITIMSRRRLKKIACSCYKPINLKF